MPAGMAFAIETGSKQSTLNGSSYSWKFIFTGTDAGSGEVIEEVTIAGTAGEFSLSGTTLTFETSEDIEITNILLEPIQITEFAGYVEIGVSGDHLVIPTVSMNTTLEPEQTLRITDIKLQVNE